MKEIRRVREIISAAGMAFVSRANLAAVRYGLWLHDCIMTEIVEYDDTHALIRLA